ncbi:MAG: PEP-CTERM sorting domain-containing protein [Sedimentisphaerales bacterium]|nr:PEP-CTERM sorting domain-containing protein [Sedimentisphaerales bacterium]
MKKQIIPLFMLSLVVPVGAELICFVEGNEVAVEGTNVFKFFLTVEIQEDTGADLDSLSLDLSHVEFPTQFDLPGKIQNVSADGLYAELTQSNIFGDPKTGPMVNGLCWTGEGQGWLVITSLFYDHYSQPDGELLRYFIPEPATMAILALGGLAVLRHRKPSRI